MKKLLIAFIMLLVISSVISPLYAQTLKYQIAYQIYIPEDEDGSKNVHSNYKNNTDTCASCHATHSAIGVSLLQWSGVSETCMACHDGTVTTTYDVVGGRFKDYNNPEYYPASGGLFSTDDDDSNVSMHNVREMVNISAAPGGTSEGVDAFLRSNNDPDYGRDAAIISWELPFTCASCHNPHGAGGNARLLQQDPNGVAQRYPLAKAQMYTFDENGDRSLWSVYPDINGDGDRDIVWKGKDVKAYTLITSYPYINDTKVYRRPKNNSMAPYELITNYTIDNTSGVTVFEFNSDPSKNNDYNLYVDGFPGVTVGVKIKNYLRLGENVEYKYGISAFCAACHEDYNTATRQFFKKSELNSKYFQPYLDQFGYFSGSGGRKETLEGEEATSGNYSQAYRHQVGMVWGINTPGLKFERDPWNPDEEITEKTDGNFIVNCLTCHVAHGVSKDYWESTLGERPNNLEDEIKFPFGIFSEYQLKELAPPSALKRMPNMAVCEACHRKGKESIQYTVNEEKD